MDHTENGTNMIDGWSMVGCFIAILTYLHYTKYNEIYICHSDI